MVFSSTRLRTSSAFMIRRSPSIGISRCSTPQYRANLCQQIWTGPVTRFGLSAGRPAARCRARQFQSRAIPPSIAASLEPVVDVPRVFAASGEFHRSARMCTQRASSSAVCGYSSLSIMFLSSVRSISRWTSGSSHVWQNVARF